jgi:hypothetical protein
MGSCYLSMVITHQLGTPPPRPVVQLGKMEIRSGHCVCHSIVDEIPLMFFVPSSFALFPQVGFFFRNISRSESRTRTKKINARVAPQA